MNKICYVLALFCIASSGNMAMAKEWTKEEIIAQLAGDEPESPPKTRGWGNTRGPRLNNGGPKHIRTERNGTSNTANKLNMNIPFEFATAELSAIAHEPLETMVEALKSDALKGKNILIVGHTDAVGDEKHNLYLSKMRAQSVYEHLTKKGIDSKRLFTSGEGEEKPLNKQEPDSEENRRVEFIAF
jgi:outer membrane protein OmpA-like peptidoglycan-associated protein